jgi:ABC-type polysaccharide/polyol phosphate transport system ATPase subunit
VSGPVLSVRGLSKKFGGQLRRSLGYGLRDMAGELLPFMTPSSELRKGEFWALRDISFDVAPGESLAVVGHNGAGKSTLLKLLHGLLKPDAGEVRIRGRLEAIIELGTGFNALLSGRENIAIGAALHGLSSSRTRRLLDEVMDFAGLDEFIDAPLQSYSSGMRARLSYALSAHLEPDLLLVDEVLAVGDVAFQRKCVNHMRTYLDGGGALLFVSHNTYQIQTLCTRGLLLERGKLTFAGTAVETLNESFERRLVAAPETTEAWTASGAVRIDSVEATPVEGDALWSGEAMRVTLRYTAQEQVEAMWGFSLWTHDHWICIGGDFDPRSRRIEAGEGSFTCVVPRLPLVGGNYLMRGGILDARTGHPLATRGVYDAPAKVFVRQRPSRSANAKLALNQLVNLDIVWD